MPNQDGSLTNSDKITFTQLLNRIVPVDDPKIGAGALGLRDIVEERSKGKPSSQSALLRVIEALSLDMMAHAVGGFVALTDDEQNSAIHNVETTLHSEFNIVLGITRDVYYEDDRTPERPTSFDGDNEIFGKVVIDTERPKPRQSRGKLRA
ncbi:MAG: gluconate 2-dehydrogenase subunit 3 family protein [Dehalococcoidia bacterium]|nr:gluconate 2-dehydrogenase subunit 3 family protein [Dehalococcoidia bacterium]